MFYLTFSRISLRKLWKFDWTFEYSHNINFSLHIATYIRDMIYFIMELQPTNLASQEHGFTNKVYVNQNTYSKINSKYVQIKEFIFMLSVSEQYQDMNIGLNSLQRVMLGISLINKIQLKQIEVNNNLISQIIFNVKSFKTTNKDLNEKEILRQIQSNFQQIVFLKDMQILIQVENQYYVAQVTNLSLLSDQNYGFIEKETEIKFKSHDLNLESEDKGQQVFSNNFSLDKLNIGGLDEELNKIFRRVFATRRFPDSVLKKYGKTHVKGLLLFGPPGNGKTLIARQLSKALNSVEPKIVNGPSIMSKFVGETEQNVRNLFKEAIDDEKRKGHKSPLHVIIFDEIDAVCKQRGSGQNSQVYDSVVNQLLTMIDGIDSLNNILVIGMTNRKDLLDEAMLRPGRFDVQIEIKLPDQKGRLQILKIHTKNMLENKVLSKDVDLDLLSKLSKNYTGAELEELCKTACSWAFDKIEGLKDFSKELTKIDVVVTMKDFQNALSEIIPQFGIDQENLEKILRGQFNYFSSNLNYILQKIHNCFNVQKQNTSIILTGDIGSGKTMLASKAAKDSQFPYIKIISQEQLIGYSEQQKILKIQKIFDDAYKSKNSIIILDDIERLIELSMMGLRYSNLILQTLLVLIKKIPKQEDHKIVIIGTCNNVQAMKELEIYQQFNQEFVMPNVDKQNLEMFLQDYTFKTQEDRDYFYKQYKEMPVGQLINLIEMNQENKEINVKMMF